MEVNLSRDAAGAWVAEILLGQHAYPHLPLAARTPLQGSVREPSLFEPQQLYRRVYDCSVEETGDAEVQRGGELWMVPWSGEKIKDFTFRGLVCSLPYCSWGVGRPIVPIHGSVLPPGWRRSKQMLANGKTVEWAATEPLSVPLKFEAVDVNVLGVPKSRSGPARQCFSLQEHGFTWVRRGESCSPEAQRWFGSASAAEALAGVLRDWRSELWEAGLRNLLMARLSEELGAPVVEISPLICDLQKRRGRYDRVYWDFLHGAVAKEHGIVGPELQREYFRDRDLDLATSSCDQRDGRATANPYIPMVLDVGQVPPPRWESIAAYNRRPAREGLAASHLAAAWPAHIDLYAEGPTSHLLRAAEVGEVLPCEGGCRMPDGEPVPAGVPLRREMMQCWVLRDERITCMPLALFHDFRDGRGPAAVVPELGRGDVLLWRSGHVLHGALTAAARGERAVALGVREPLGAVLGPHGELRSVDARGRAAAEGLRPGDALAAVDGGPVAPGGAAAALRLARRGALRAGRPSLRLTFLLPRYNGRRSVEFRFFVYWPA